MLRNAGFLVTPDHHWPQKGFARGKSLEFCNYKFAAEDMVSRLAEILEPLDVHSRRVTQQEFLNVLKNRPRSLDYGRLTADSSITDWLCTTTRPEPVTRP